MLEETENDISKEASILCERLDQNDVFKFGSIIFNAPETIFDFKKINSRIDTVISLSSKNSQILETIFPNSTLIQIPDNFPQSKILHRVLYELSF